MKLSSKTLMLLHKKTIATMIITITIPENCLSIVYTTKVTKKKFPVLLAKKNSFKITKFLINTAAEALNERADTMKKRYGREKKWNDAEKIASDWVA